jgi:hypothetical protein
LQSNDIFIIEVSDFFNRHSIMNVKNYLELTTKGDRAELKARLEMNAEYMKVGAKEQSILFTFFIYDEVLLPFGLL